MAPLSKAHLVAFTIGIFSHHAYFIHGEHLTNIPTLLLLAMSTYGLCVLSLSTLLGLSYASVGFTVSQICATYLTGLWFSILIYRAFFHRLNRIPGPFGARLSKFYHVFAIRRLDQYRWFDKLHREYGPVVRVGPSSVSICDPDALDAVHGARSKCVKSVMYDISLPFTTLQQMRDRSMHDRRRRAGGWDDAFNTKCIRDPRSLPRVCADTYKALRNYDQRLIKYATLLENSLQASLGKPINISDRLSWYSFDVMGDLTFGHSFNGLEAQKTHWAITSIRESNMALGLLGPIPWLIHLMTKLPNFMNPMYKLLLFSEDSVEKRRQLDPSEPDVMSHLLNAEPFFSDPEKEYQLFTGDARLLVIGGSDTTATALSFLFYHLAADPDLQQNLLNELTAHGLTTSEDITVQTVQDLPYLNALINETLRVHPPVPSAPVRDTPSEGLQIGSINVPGDITMYTPLYSIHHSPEAFEHPDDFIPERWTTRPQLIRNKKAFAPFLIGAYSCIGRQLAYAEMRTVVSKLMLNFSVALAEGETGDKLLHESLDNFTMTIGALNVVLTARKAAV